MMRVTPINLTPSCWRSNGLSGHKYTLIDCSRTFPLFLVGFANTPAGPLQCMERSEAELTLVLAKDLAKAESDYRLNAVWPRLERAVNDARHDAHTGSVNLGFSKPSAEFCCGASAVMICSSRSQQIVTSRV